MIDVYDLDKNFGKVQAVKGVSFSTKPGEVYDLLGPNGAGKTTTLRILATLLTADRGEASVAGYDIHKESERLRKNIGVANGGMGLYDREILHYFGKLYGMSREKIAARIT